jgi:hypothetical protein
MEMNIFIKNQVMNQKDAYCLSKDLELLKEYNGDDFFVTKTSTKKMTLIPQFWWGNITNPKLIVFANNPSYKCEHNSNLSDDKDNEDNNTREYLERNIFRPDKFNCDFINSNSDAYFSFWWKNKFFENNKVNLNNIGIFNLIGYYSKNSSFFNKKILLHSHILQFSNQLIEYIQSNSDVILTFVWKGSVDYWRRAIGKDNFSKMCKNRKIYVANKGHRYSPRLNGACRFIIETNKYDETDCLNIDDFK